MRHVIAAASLVAILAACTSETEGEDCSFVGTYAMSGAIESTTCVFPPSDGAPTIVQVSTAPDDIDGDYVWSFQGATGRCALRKTGTCKLEGRCPVTVTDATTSNNQAEILVSWSFDAKGFGGTSSLTAPPFKDNPNGCVQTARNTATRR